jgi:hypothetical protein
MRLWKSFLPGAAVLFLNIGCFNVANAAGNSNVLAILPNSAQAGNESVVTRDPEALAVLQKVVQSLAPGHVTLSDYSVAGTVTRWSGADTSGTFAELNAGVDTRSTIVQVGGISAYAFTSRGDYGERQYAATPSSAILSREATMASTYVFPLPLIQDTLANPNTDVRYIPDPAGDTSTLQIQIARTVHGFAAEIGKQGTFTFRVYINAASLTIDSIANDEHVGIRLQQVLLHTIRYSGYQPEGSFLVPHSIEESRGGSVRSRYVVTSFSSNSGVNLTGSSAK